MHHDVSVQRWLEPWTVDFLREKQLQDADLCKVIQWVELAKKPHWEDIQGESPTLKAYYQQWDSLFLKNGVQYRHLEQLSKSEVPDQLLLPRALWDEFLTMIHGGVAGHLGAFKTRMHVGRCGYWFRWWQDVDIFCRNCVHCNEFHWEGSHQNRAASNPFSWQHL